MLTYMYWGGRNGMPAAPLVIYTPVHTKHRHIALVVVVSWVNIVVPDEEGVAGGLLCSKFR
jgi:hypothetical protein